MSDEKYAVRITKFFRKEKRMPSLGELAKLVGFKSKNAAKKLADRLIVQGILSRGATGKLLPNRLFDGVRLLGLVEAGFPSPAEEELLDVMNFDEYLTPNKESTYILKVKGDSMIDAGIHPGDMVIVERRQSYKPGQIVVAMIDGEYTMKYLRRSTGSTALTTGTLTAGRSTALTAGKQGEYYLEPANAKYKPIYPREAFRVEAVVTAVVRKY